MALRLPATILLLSLASFPQHQHAPAGSPAAFGDAAAHHACLEQERAAIERGEGFGMAMAADRNGYPGPRHVLDWKKELQLSPAQRASMEQIYARMHEQAVAQGRSLRLAEQKLGELFAQNRLEAELRAQSAHIDALHAELRWTHLRAHLAARKLLAPEQLAAYQRLRTP